MQKQKKNKFLSDLILKNYFYKLSADNQINALLDCITDFLYNNNFPAKYDKKYLINYIKNIY